MTVARDMQSQLARVIAAQGTSGLFYKAADFDAGAKGTPVRFLLRHPGVRDDAIVNAYGVNAQILTIPNVAPFNCTPPERFDVIVQDDSLRYVLDAVVRRALADTVIAWTAYVRGKGA